MSRIHELQRKYPTIPREIIVKWEVLNRGINDNDDLDKVSYWVRSHGIGSYQSHDHGQTLKQVVERKPGRTRPGHLLTPSPFYMSNGLGARIQRDATSPYEVRGLDSGGFALYEGEERVDMPIYFLPHKSRSAEEATTSRGTPVSSLVPIRQRCFMIAPVRHCEYFTTREECKFCNYNATQDVARSVGLSRPVAISLEDTVEAYKILSSNVRLAEGCFGMGGFVDREKEAKIHISFVEAIASAASYKPNLRVGTQPLNRKNMHRLKDAGLDCIMHQMEVWDPQLFAEVCPGKAKYIGRERYLEVIQEALDVFGVGNVNCNFAGGVTLIPPNGHKTWEEARDSHIEGNTWMIRNGVMPTFLSLRLGAGSVYGDDSASRAKAPPTEYYLEVVQAHHETMMEYGLYSKLNKLMNCGLCGIISQYCGELGMLELAGDIGKWMSDCISSEVNWLARFISSLDPATASPGGGQ